MTEQGNHGSDPHQGQPVRAAGVPLVRAHAAVLMVHGRGARAEEILSLSEQLAMPGFAFLAPQAAQDTWYPRRFLEPLSSNEPWLGSALAFVGHVLAQIGGAGIPSEHTILLGFSQGACLALEFAARNARRYAGVVGLSGALIGPQAPPRSYAGSLAGTPVFLGCSDEDSHVPKEYVQGTAEALQRLGGEVSMRLYPHMDHTVNQDEIEAVRGLMQPLAAGG